MYSVQYIKQKFRIIGNSLAINRAIEKAIQVASTDISVLVSGESGVGKEFIPKIIHFLSSRKHNNYIAVNCGAIPEGTIDSELFGHEKGAFTGAVSTRRGYFEVANGGTIFLDEIAELPLSTQVKLLRILETGEFIKVGSSNIQKTSLRIIAATNKDLLYSIKKNKFREDLFYRLNTVQIEMPALRERKHDIELLFNKFSNDFITKYHIPSIQMTAESINYMKNYHWPGNVRQLRNFTENICILEINRVITLDKIREYLPHNNKELSLPVLVSNASKKSISDEIDVFYKILFDMRKDINELKNLILEIVKNNVNLVIEKNTHNIIRNNTFLSSYINNKEDKKIKKYNISDDNSLVSYNENNDILKNNPLSESLYLHNKELECIQKALKKCKGKRKIAAKELGISERTLYRKIKQYNL